MMHYTNVRCSAIQCTIKLQFKPSMLLTLYVSFSFCVGLFMTSYCNDMIWENLKIRIRILLKFAIIFSSIKQKLKSILYIMMCRCFSWSCLCCFDCSIKWIPSNQVILSVYRITNAYLFWAFLLNWLF